MKGAPLDNKVIVQSLSRDARNALRVSVRQSVGSTSDEVRDLARGGSAHGAVVLAEEQTQGRGRRGRVWHSPAGANLYCSVGWEFSQGMSQLSGLGLAVGAIVADMLASEYAVELQLKWPNDLFFNGRKLGGILIESPGNLDGQQQVIIGLGLNIDMPESAHQAINRPWTDLREVLGEMVDRNALAAALLSYLVSGLDRFKASGLAPWVSVWEERDFLRGRSVLVDGVPPVSGVAAGIDCTGELILETEAGRRLIAGGEASLLEVGPLQ